VLSRDFFLSFQSTSGASKRLDDLVGGRAPDARALAAWVNWSFPRELDDTPYVGVRSRLHEPALPRGDDDEGRACSSPEKAATLLRGRLRDVVEKTLHGARRVAVLTGGGVDSSGLLVLALEWAKRTGGTAFAVGLDYDAPYSDQPHLRALEMTLDCEVVRVLPEEAAARVRSLMAGVDGAPLCSPWSIVEVELMARARAHGADCVLTGTGGDELFDGDPRALASLARRGRILSAMRISRRLRDFLWEEPRFPIASWVVRPLVVSLAPKWLRLARARRAPHVPPWAGPLLRDAIRDARARSASKLSDDLDRGRVELGAEIAEHHRVALAWGRHQHEIAACIERRDPFLDRSLFALLHSLPPDWLLHGGIRRGLFREAFRAEMPDSVRMREGKAFVEPAYARAIKAAGGVAQFAQLARDTQLGAMGIVEPRRFEEAFNAFALDTEMEKLVPWTVWNFLCLEAFVRARLGLGRSSCASAA
jgi:asparagine synthetase B (glutamine-hydrolysing)